MRNLHVKILALLLTAIGLSLCYYKVHWLGLPLHPTERADVWTVEARIDFRPLHHQPVTVDFALPGAPRGYTIVDENFAASDYGLTTSSKMSQRYAHWTVREIEGDQVLYYRVHLATGSSLSEPQTTRLNEDVALPDYPDMIRPAVKAILDQAKRKSADTLSFSREVVMQFNGSAPDANVSLLRQDTVTADDRVRRIIYILAGGGVRARLAHVLMLRDGVKHGDLTPWLEVRIGSEWLAINPQTAETDLPGDAVLWHTGDTPILDINGGYNSKLSFSVSRHSQVMELVAEQRAKQLGSRVMEFSLFTLPVQTQNIYRVLLTIPLGALLVVVLRNVVGIKTFGTFMPILIALAFRETKLLWGVALFSVVVAIGLIVRFYLESLKLLLVPRLAAVLTLVILIMTTISIFSYKLSLEGGVSVALFPMVILAMTIERTSLTWEELGAYEAFQQFMGSLMVAVLGYLLMSSKVLAHLVFVFPELLLVVLAVILLLGRYTGYRLTELWRFRTVLWE
jgi:hypothetical protein